MRVFAMSFGLVGLLLLQIIVSSDAAAQGKRKKGKKNGKTHAAETAVEEESSGDTDEGAAEEGAAEEDASQGGNEKSINERLHEDESGGLRRPGRMEFDERLIKGQAAKSGAVYLFKRIPRHLPGLVPMRRSYRSRIVEPILGAVILKPARYSYELSDKDLAAVKAEEEKAAELAAAQAGAPETESASEEADSEEAVEEAPTPTKKKRK